ncbi:YceD family protein [Corynebacterium pygosceleis]|uniref:YceD family protein n=1 Tax=Corynebacterium pygosceleis TaxID=2800406 RepID=A0A9Q4GIU7_9CORY|nr:YceD family protein [Corynebacterium pygosceleis]MCK7636711.1 YceD family protein [Corynebacterium pygosceleis]MCL0120501.1 YceD family protein [Corynebacterium pygosceleis]MCX7444051.1 YceD family protein [Corynebacterium pygosceleis]MCX7467464.1 YceD family protein [Corynebacterium pygosceleis]
MNSPFVFDVATLLRSSATPTQRTQTGPSPLRIGLPLVAIDEGADVTVEAFLSPLGDAVLVDATVTAPLSGECARCLRPLDVEHSFHVNEVFAASDDFISGDAADDDAEENPPRIEGTELDIQQSLTDVVGLNLPFSPTCGYFGIGECDSDRTPEPDGVSGEDEKNLPDPRWAGLEKFL